MGHVFGRSVLSPSVTAQNTKYRGGVVENIEVKIKCPFCFKMISLEFDLKECICVFKPEIQKYEITHSVTCGSCGNEVKNVTIYISRKKEWDVS